MGYKLLNLNTSYVKVKLILIIPILGFIADLNTSHVKVKQLYHLDFYIFYQNLNTSHVKVKRCKLFRCRRHYII